MQRIVRALGYTECRLSCVATNTGCSHCLKYSPRCSGTSSYLVQVVPWVKLWTISVLLLFSFNVKIIVNDSYNVHLVWNTAETNKSLCKPNEQQTAVVSGDKGHRDVSSFGWEWEQNTETRGAALNGWQLGWSQLCESHSGLDMVYIRHFDALYLLMHTDTLCSVV